MRGPETKIYVSPQLHIYNPCQGKKGYSILSFANRGLDTVISLYGQEESLSCGSCKACIDVCPVKALLINETDSATPPLTDNLE